MSYVDGAYPSSNPEYQESIGDLPASELDTTAAYDDATMAGLGAEDTKPIPKDPEGIAAIDYGNEVDPHEDNITDVDAVPMAVPAIHRDTKPKSDHPEVRANPADQQTTVARAAARLALPRADEVRVRSEEVDDKITKTIDDDSSAPVKPEIHPTEPALADSGSSSDRGEPPQKPPAPGSGSSGETGDEQERGESDDDTDDVAGKRREVRPLATTTSDQVAAPLTPEESPGTAEDVPPEDVSVHQMTLAVFNDIRKLGDLDVSEVAVQVAHRLAPVVERPMGATAVHFLRDGIKIGAHPSRTMEWLIRSKQNREAEMQQLFDEYIGGVPKLNEKYASELALANYLLLFEDLPSPPTFVLDREAFEKARKIIGQAREHVDGFSWRGKSYIAESTYPAEYGEDFGHQLVLAIALHEGAHYHANSRRPHVAASVYTPGKLWGVRTRFTSESPSAEQRLMLRAGKGPTSVGSFLVEGYAQYAAVMMLSRVGMQAQQREDIVGINFELPDGGGIRYINPDKEPVIDGPEGLTEIPITFAAATVYKDSVVGIAPTETSIPAYGFALLDTAARRQNPGQPSLYEQMKEAYRDPVQAKEYIKTINGVRPGLYQELRDVADTASTASIEGYSRGLRLIQQAVAQANPKTVD
jgi:hypothetical protein